jgi:hypothetical protein
MDFATLLGGIAILLFVILIIGSFVSKTYVTGLVRRSPPQKMTWFVRIFILLAGSSGTRAVSPSLDVHPLLAFTWTMFRSSSSHRQALVTSALLQRMSSLLIPSLASSGTTARTPTTYSAPIAPIVSGLAPQTMLSLMRRYPTCSNDARNCIPPIREVVAAQGPVMAGFSGNHGSVVPRVARWDSAFGSFGPGSVVPEP